MVGDGPKTGWQIDGPTSKASDARQARLNPMEQKAIKIPEEKSFILMKLSKGLYPTHKSSLVRPVVGICAGSC